MFMRLRSFVALITLLFMIVALSAIPSHADVDETPDIDPQVMEFFEKGWLAYQEKRYLEVPGLLDQALAKAREVHDVPGEAIALLGQSEMYRRIGFAAQAKQLNDQAMQV